MRDKILVNLNEILLGFNLIIYFSRNYAFRIVLGIQIKLLYFIKLVENRNIFNLQWYIILEIYLVYTKLNKDFHIFFLFSLKRNFTQKIESECDNLAYDVFLIYSLFHFIFAVKKQENFNELKWNYSESIIEFFINFILLDANAKIVLNTFFYVW